MRIGETSGIGSGFGIERRALDRRVEPIGDAPRPRPEAEHDPVPGHGRALVATTVARRAETDGDRLVRRFAHAPFLAQLIATREDVPDTRRRRRAEPARAARLYDEAMEGPGLLIPGYLVDVAR
ncbi:MAG: hypothetical protein OEL76_10570 [Siculibacillus sp.]|nr:hypothetical protein [Siculibacillus sp.]